MALKKDKLTVKKILDVCPLHYGLNSSTDMFSYACSQKYVK